MGDVRARSGVEQLNAGTKTIHSAYKDLRRRDRYSADFRPTPYDVWSFRQDRAFGIPHPGPSRRRLWRTCFTTLPRREVLSSIPWLAVVTTTDVAQSMGRRCLAYDLHPVRPEIQRHDIRHAFQPRGGCDLVFCDPPYHTMLTRQYAEDSVANVALSEWVHFLHELTANAFFTLRPGGRLALLLAPQTEKIFPRGSDILITLSLATLPPLAQDSCLSDGSVAPWTVHTYPSMSDEPVVTARLLGQVRDLLVMRKHPILGTLMGSLRCS